MDLFQISKAKFDKQTLSFLESSEMKHFFEMFQKNPNSLPNVCIEEISSSLNHQPSTLSPSSSSSSLSNLSLKSIQNQLNILQLRSKNFKFFSTKRSDFILQNRAQNSKIFINGDEAEVRSLTIDDQELIVYSEHPNSVPGSCWESHVYGSDTVLFVNTTDIEPNCDNSPTESMENFGTNCKNFIRYQLCEDNRFIVNGSRTIDLSIHDNFRFPYFNLTYPSTDKSSDCQPSCITPPPSPSSQTSSSSPSAPSSSHSSSLEPLELLFKNCLSPTRSAPSSLSLTGHSLIILPENCHLTPDTESEYGQTFLADKDPFQFDGFHVEEEFSIVYTAEQFEEDKGDKNAQIRAYLKYQNRKISVRLKPSSYSIREPIQSQMISSLALMVTFRRDSICFAPASSMENFKIDYCFEGFC